MYVVCVNRFSVLIALYKFIFTFRRWQLLDFDDSDWPNAEPKMLNSEGYLLFAKPSNFSKHARWISTSTSDNRGHIYCRKTFVRLA